MSDIEHVDTDDLEPRPRRPTELDRAIGARVRRYRRYYKVTQAMAAETIGVSHPQMQKYETGINRVTLSALIRLSRAFGMAPHEFISSICADIETEQPPLKR